MQPAEALDTHGGEPCPACDARTCEFHCGAVNHQSELYGPWCSNRAGFKTGHVGIGRCHLHGGATPASDKSARRKLAQKALAVHLRDLVYEPLGDPVVELADLAAKWRTLADWGLAQSAELETAAAGPMLAQATELAKQARGMLTDCGRLGLEARRVKLLEDQLDLAAAVVMGVLRRAGLDPDTDQVQGWLEATYVELEAGAT